LFADAPQVSRPATFAAQGAFPWLDRFGEFEKILMQRCALFGTSTEKIVLYSDFFPGSVTGLIVRGKKILAPIIVEIAPDTVNMVSVVLRFVIFDEEF
jgi:hypothetical protein